MEPAPIRDQVHDFIRACEALAGFAHEHAGLTDQKRETVRSFLRALEEETSPSPQKEEVYHVPSSHVTILD